MKSFLLGSIFFALNLSLYGQEFAITGTVFSEEGESLSEAHVYLSETKWAITDSKGQFFISAVSPGKYQLKISRIGYQEQTVDVDFTGKSLNPISIYLQEKIYENSTLVVTASRTEKELEDVSVPISVVNKEEIQKSGSLRLTDILDEQIGLSLVSDHGTGIQVQGFDPDYTLIMIDNQPVIGRSGGTLDLDRLAVGNIQQIEVVKGPSSALWGSEALAGVINIITDKGSEPFSWDVNGRYGTFNSYDASSNLTFKQNRFSGRFFTNLNSSDGYDLLKETRAPTVAAYDNYTVTGGLDFRASDNLTFKIGGRYFREELNYPSEGVFEGDSVLIRGDQLQEDYSFTPEVYWNIGSRELFEFTGFFNRYNSFTDEVIEGTGQSFYFTNFDQTLNKYEIKSSTFWDDNNTSVFGTGINREDLVSEIYADVPGFTSFFVYGQHELVASDELSFTGGFRFDAHSEYSTQFSPKFSGLYKPTEKIHIRASVGSGFKAPTFNQLFLNFTNATVGYSVFGTSTVIEGMQGLEESGQIFETYIPVSSVTDIDAESSFSYNAGFDIIPSDALSFKINLFRNNIQDMIDTQRIALKTNGQAVFSYFNLEQVYTQGFEAEVRYAPEAVPNLRLNLGYQYLDARSQYEDTFDTVENGVLITQTETKWGILPGRSKHTGNFKIFYTWENLGLDATLRATHRSKYGIDQNGNERVDTGEYVNTASTFGEALEKTIINASLGKEITDRLKVLFGVNNLTNFQDPVYQPHYPGTTFYTQLNIKLF